MARKLLIGLALATALVAAAPAAGDDIYDKKRSVDERLAHLHDQLDGTRRRESALRAQIASVGSEIRALERRVGDVSTELRPLERELELRELKLNRLNALFGVQTERLVFLRRQYAASLARLNARLVAIYESDETEPLAAVFSAKGFTELLDAIDYVRQIGDEDKRIADEVGRAKREVQRARARTKTLRAVVAAAAQVTAIRVRQVRTLRDELVANHAQLSAARARKRQSLASLTGEERAEAEEIDALVEVSARLAEKIRAAEAAAAAARPSSGAPEPSAAGLIWPVNGSVTSPFGWRWGRMHTGVDIAVPYGTAIAAAAAGTVIYAGWLGGYGNLVVVDHGGGLATAYAHQSQIAVSQGEVVSQGQVLGYVGCTGHCFGPHLHFEVRVNGEPVDPLGYL